MLSQDHMLPHRQAVESDRIKAATLISKALLTEKTSSWCLRIKIKIMSWHFDASALFSKFLPVQLKKTIELE
jgi:hypothetical protein